MPGLAHGSPRSPALKQQRSRASRASSTSASEVHDEALAEASIMALSMRAATVPTPGADAMDIVLEQMEAKRSGADPSRRVRFADLRPQSEAPDAQGPAGDSVGRSSTRDSSEPAVETIKLRCAKMGLVMRRALRITLRIVTRVVLLLARELLKALRILVPAAIGFVAHSEEPLSREPSVWLGRPLYAALSGRVMAAILLSVLTAPALIELLPTKVNMLVAAYAGWPLDVIAYLIVTAGCYNSSGISAAHTAELDVWQRIRVVEWLVGINLWLCALALTRGALDFGSELAFLSVKDGHYQTRVAQALLSMRCMRLTFATGREARARAYHRQQRHKSGEPASPPGGTATHGWRLSTVQYRPLISLLSHRPKPAPPTERAEKELFVLEDSTFAEALSSISEQLGQLQSALSKEAAERARKAFTALLAEHHHELERADAPRGIDDESIPRARLVRWCTLATAKRGKVRRRFLNWF
ncbi:hypothetical protein T492DRAFT_882695 [Pavlovales sp. CCMP2436]|nr:hypothetical protein T492DRAFT_882695 [Pavlovales sp. CCMP2436]